MFGELFFFSSRRRHTRFDCDWSSDVCSSDLEARGDSCGGPTRLSLGRYRPYACGDRERIRLWYSSLILVDSNIPMYLVGAAHPHKADAQRLLENLISNRLRLVTDAEVLQEILHRYVAINRRDAIQPAFDALLGVADQVLAVDWTAAERAKEIVMGHRQMSARDAVHLAVMEQHGIERILSFDSGFDGFPGITRLS